MFAKANPDDLVHEEGPLYLVSEQTLRTLVTSHSVDEALADLMQDNYVQVEVLEHGKVDLYRPPF